MSSVQGGPALFSGRARCSGAASARAARNSLPQVILGQVYEVKEHRAPGYVLRHTDRSRQPRRVVAIEGDQERAHQRARTADQRCAEQGTALDADLRIVM